MPEAQNRFDDAEHRFDVVGFFRLSHQVVDIVPQLFFKLDGPIVSDDFSAFIDGWRQPNTEETPNRADLNGDGTADLADFWILRQAIVGAGGGVIDASLLAGVPEPNALTPVAMGLLISAIVGRRR